jgi:hypothetical protein
MKAVSSALTILLFCCCFIYADVSGDDPDNPPPADSLSLVFAGVDYGGNFSSPQDYPNAKHVTNVIVGSYYFPVIIWESGNSWGAQSLFSYWDDLFEFWSYPDSFTTNNGQDTGRGNVWADQLGHLHFAWHQTGWADGYEVFYTKALLDTSAGVIQYNVDRLPIMLSETNGREETNPVLCVHNNNPFVVWLMGYAGGSNLLMFNYSTDGGTTWQGADTAYSDSIAGTWGLPCIAPDPTTGDMWVSISFDADGDNSSDIVALHYTASSGIWEKEVAACSPDSYSYAVPAISVDYNGRPGIVFQRNQGGFANVGPIGLQLFTRKVSGSWIPPETLRCSPSDYIDETSGWPSVGITDENDIYIAFTQVADSASMNFQVYYSKIIPDSGIYNIARGIVSVDNDGDSIGGIYPHMTYNFPLTGPFAGPGITWAVVPNATPPSDIYYKHMLPILTQGIYEDHGEKGIGKLSLHAYPNPFRKKTEIRLLGDWERGREGGGEIHIYGLSGRLVRKLVPCDLCSCVLSWDGCDDAGHRVAPGVYFVKLAQGKKVLTKKVIMVK